MRRLMIGTLAGAAQWSSQDQKNCYNHNGHFCNIGDYLRVSTPSDRVEGPALSVRITSPTYEGVFDCPAVKEAIYNNVLRNLLDEYSSVLPNGRGKAQGYVICWPHGDGINGTEPVHHQA